MAKYKTMARRKTYYRRRRRYAKAMNMRNNYFAEKLRKRFTIPVLVGSTAGIIYFYGDDSKLNIADALKTSSSFSAVYSDGVPLYQRIRITGISVEWVPLANTPTPPLAFGLFPDYANTNLVPQTVIDQKDRFLVLPSLTNKPQRKYWAFPSRSNVFGINNLPVLGSWLDVATFNAAGQDSIPGQLVVAQLIASNGSYASGTLVLNIYTELDKPLR